MARRQIKPVSPEAKEAAESEKLMLTKQQAASVLASQKAAQDAQQAATLVLRGVLDAAGIDNADVTGGDMGAAEPFLTIRRKA